MHEKCCCGCCTLYAGTSLALAFAATQAVIGIFINVELLLIISENGVFNPVRLVVNIEEVEDFDVFHGIVLAALGLNGFWFAFSVFAAAGNISQSHGRLTPWIFLTYLRCLFEFGVSIYYTVKFQDSIQGSLVFYENNVPTKTLTYLTLLCISSGGGILLFINFFLAHIVERRGKEIDHDYSTLVLYILSHMGRCTHMNDEMQQNLIPEAPPSYSSNCPPYLPREIYERTNDFRGSSWSLSYETLKRTSSEQENLVDERNSLRRNILTAEHLATMMRTNTNGYQSLEGNPNQSSVLPY